MRLTSAPFYNLPITENTTDESALNGVVNSRSIMKK